MSAAVEFRLNTAADEEIAAHLSRCDGHFVPPLSERVTIKDYASKIASQATRFEAWSSGSLIGLVAAYCNDKTTGVAYITSVSVLHEWIGQGLAKRLVSQCVEYVRSAGMRHVKLEVAQENAAALKLYEKSGFSIETHGPIIKMVLTLPRGTA